MHFQPPLPGRIRLTCRIVRPPSTASSFPFVSCIHSWHLHIQPPNCCLSLFFASAVCCLHAPRSAHQVRELANSSWCRLIGRGQCGCCSLCVGLLCSLRCIRALSTRGCDPLRSSALWIRLRSIAGLRWCCGSGPLQAAPTIVAADPPTRSSLAWTISDSDETKGWC